MYRSLRNQFGGLGLLPARHNISINDLPFSRKIELYGKYNILLGVLSPQYDVRNRPLRDFIGQHGLDSALRRFGAAESMEDIVNTRQRLYLKLCELVWNPLVAGASTRPDDATVAGTDAYRDRAAKRVDRSPASASPQRPGRATDVAKMVDAGVLVPGQKMVLAVNGAEHWATIGADGGIALQATGFIYRKPNEAGAVVCGTKDCDGFKRWRVCQENGERVPLGQLRDAARSAGLLRARGR